MAGRQKDRFVGEAVGQERRSLTGDDLRREPLAVRKAALERVIAQAMSGIRFNEHLEHEVSAPVSL